MEAHHLIPMRESGNSVFKGSLDVHSNIVSLCSECHNRIHYGKDKKIMIEKLYQDRKSRLKDAKIDVTLDMLLGFYKEK